MSVGIGRERQFEIYIAGARGSYPTVPVSIARLEAAARKRMSAEGYAYIAGGAGDDHGGRRGLADVAGEHAPVESVEAGAPPPPAGEEQGQCQSGHAPARIGDRHGHDHGNDGEHGCTSGNPAGRGGRQAQARAARENIGVAQEQAPTRSVETRAGFRHAHGTTSPRSCSIRAGPIPGTSSSSSTERKAPCSAR